MHTETEFEMAGKLMRDLKAMGRAARKRVAAKNAIGQCLGWLTADERTDAAGNDIGWKNWTEDYCTAPARRRGHCDCCFHRFWMELQRTPEYKRASFERNAIADGRILPPRQGQGGGRKRKHKVSA